MNRLRDDVDCLVLMAIYACRPYACTRSLLVWVAKKDAPQSLAEQLVDEAIKGLAQLHLIDIDAAGLMTIPAQPFPSDG